MLRRLFSLVFAVAATIGLGSNAQAIVKVLQPEVLEAGKTPESYVKVAEDDDDDDDDDD